MFAALGQAKGSSSATALKTLSLTPDAQPFIPPHCHLTAAATPPLQLGFTCTRAHLCFHASAKQVATYKYDIKPMHTHYEEGQSLSVGVLGEGSEKS